VPRFPMTVSGNGAACLELGEEERRGFLLVGSRAGSEEGGEGLDFPCMVFEAFARVLIAIIRFIYLA